MAKQITYSSLTENQKNLVDFIEGMDNGKGIRDFSAEVVYSVSTQPEGKAPTKSAAIILSEGQCKAIRRDYRGGIAALLRSADEVIIDIVGRQEQELNPDNPVEVKIDNIVWVPTNSLTDFFSEDHIE